MIETNYEWQGHDDAAHNEESRDVKER